MMKYLLSFVLHAEVEIVATNNYNTISVSKSIL